mmetsp:Transcript_19269/g.60611  ORF Transcript_19269/g.60611 Transcript_19269/m.60611 type:complete len:441 (+) Transcript_19269:80-1402(+)
MRKVRRRVVAGCLVVSCGGGRCFSVVGRHVGRGRRSWSHPVDEGGEGAKIPKRKVALLLGYQGAKYYGLQRQEALPTIEGEVERALSAAGLVSASNAGDLSKIGWSRAARTDKRVSAARLVAAAKLTFEDDDVEAGLDRLNAALPPEIRVFDAVRVTKAFDSKKACDRRRYAYLLPTALLAGAEFVADAFGSRDVERAREGIMAAKRDPGSFDWRLGDAERGEIARRLAEYRASSEDLERLKAFLAAYRGTRNFHNFTAGMDATSEAAKRFILSFDASDPLDGPGAQWLRLEVLGQSFMLHQIRKMVAVAAEATRRRLDPAILDHLCDPNVDLPLQLVPGVGLYLAEPVFDSYNRRKAPEAGHPPLEWTSDHPKFPAIDAFRRDVIEPAILRRGHPDALLPFVDYLWMLRIFGFSLSLDEPRHPVNDSVRADSSPPPPPP